MKFIRKTYWYATAYLQKHGLVILGAVAIGIVMFTLVFRVFSAISPVKPTRYIGRTGFITLATLPLDIQQKISDGLTSVDQTGNPVPALADRWVIEDDGKTYRFVLGENTLWQDGKRLQPQDVQYNFSDAQVLTTQNEVIFKLKQSFSPFPVVVSQPLFRSEKKRSWFVFSKTVIIGTGAYTVNRLYEEGDRITQLELESPQERLVYRFYPTENRSVLAFKRGEVDVLERITSQKDFVGWKRVRATPAIQQNEYLAVFFDNNNPVFDKPIRQALNYALPKPQGDERAETPINPRSWAYNKTVKTYASDQEKAVALLLKVLPKEKIEFELSTVPNFQKDAENIKSLWEAFGIEAAKECSQSKDVANTSSCKNLEIAVQLKIVNVPDVSNFQALLIAQESPQDPDQYYLWHSTQQTNFTGYRNPHVDKLLEDGRSIVNQKERKSIYQDFQQILVDDSPAIFLNHLTWYTIERI